VKFSEWQKRAAKVKSPPPGEDYCIPVKTYVVRSHWRKGKYKDPDLVKEIARELQRLVRNVAGRRAA
jgi:hypothetical protein